MGGEKKQKSAKSAELEAQAAIMSTLKPIAIKRQLWHVGMQGNFIHVHVFPRRFMLINTNVLAYMKLLYI